MSIPIKTVAAAFACLSFVALPAVADVGAVVEGLVERPLPPMALTVTTSDAGNMLSWEPPLADVGAPLDVYNVYRLVNGVEESLGSVSASQTSFLDGDVALDGNTTYAYYVTSESASGESLPSNLGFEPYPYCQDIIPLDLNPNDVKLYCIWPVPFIGPVVVIH